MKRDYDFDGARRNPYVERPPRRETAVGSDPHIQGGTPVFRGTRVPVRTLFDYLAGGAPIEEFLEDFPSVTRDQAVTAIELAGEIFGEEPDSRP